MTAREVSPHSPAVSVTYPNGSEEWGASEIQTITWNASDPDSDLLSFNVYYSSNGLHWIPLALETMETQLPVTVSEIAGSVTALIRVEASDGFNTTVDESDAMFTVAGKSPQALIITPRPGETAVMGSPVLLSGTSYDAEDGFLKDNSVSWYSNIDGFLGSGSPVLASLSLGQHTITLTATDSDLNSSSSEILLNVLDCHALTMMHVGQGSDPTASPSHSEGCPSGSFLEGETISVTAIPDSGWVIFGWIGTDNDTSTSATNTLNMPPNDLFVTATYINSDAPSVTSIARLDANPTRLMNIRFTVNFSEPVSGVDTIFPFSDFSLATNGVTGAAITSVNGSGNIYTT